MKYIFYLLRRIIVSFFIIYAYNSFAISFNMLIPINYINVSLVSLFGLCALFELVAFYFIL